MRLKRKGSGLLEFQPKKKKGRGVHEKGRGQTVCSLSLLAKNARGCAGRGVLTAKAREENKCVRRC